MVDVLLRHTAALVAIHEALKLRELLFPSLSSDCCFLLLNGVTALHV